MTQWRRLGALVFALHFLITAIASYWYCFLFWNRASSEQEAERLAALRHSTRSALSAPQLAAEYPIERQARAGRSSAEILTQNIQLILHRPIPPPTANFGAPDLATLVKNSVVWAFLAALVGVGMDRLPRRKQLPERAQLTRPSPAALIPLTRIILTGFIWWLVSGPILLGAALFFEGDRLAEACATFIGLPLSPLVRLVVPEWQLNGWQYALQQFLNGFVASGILAMRYQLAERRRGAPLRALTMSPVNNLISCCVACLIILVAIALIDRSCPLGVVFRTDSVMPWCSQPLVRGGIVELAVLVILLSIVSAAVLSLNLTKEIALAALGACLITGALGGALAFRRISAANVESNRFALYLQLAADSLMLPNSDSMMFGSETPPSEGFPFEVPLVGGASIKNAPYRCGLSADELGSFTKEDAQRFAAESLGLLNITDDAALALTLRTVPDLQTYIHHDRSEEMLRTALSVAFRKCGIWRMHHLAPRSPWIVDQILPMYFARMQGTDHAAELIAAFSPLRGRVREQLFEFMHTSFIRRDFLAVTLLSKMVRINRADALEYLDKFGLEERAEIRNYVPGLN